MAEGPIKVEPVRENTADAGMLTDPNPSGLALIAAAAMDIALARSSGAQEASPA